MATRTRRPRPCTYCPKLGADACIRTLPAQAGGAHIYAHRKCAAARGVLPLYLFTDEPTPGGLR